MLKHSRLLVACLTTAVAGVTHAQCYGTGAYQNFYDSNTGNSYSVQRYGSQTNVQGYNAQTGSNWSQHSSTIGNTGVAGLGAGPVARMVRRVVTLDAAQAGLGGK